MGLLLDLFTIFFVGMAIMGAIFSLSPLGSGAEGLVENPQLLWIGVACASVPLIAGVVYLLKDWRFFGMPAKYVFITVALISLGLHTMGNTWRLSTLVLRGIEPFDYSIVKGAVYYHGEVLPADAASFKVLLFNHIAVDRDHVYVKGSILPGAKGSSFKILNRFYQSDESRVYYDYVPLEGLKPSDVTRVEYETLEAGGRIYKNGKLNP
ncbi:MAG: DKNYY domain-containing protein [Bacteriovoracaceae bacterium]|nr:DKNYY domain-containing protein [Bacteriovoracaceae bacterium]